MFNDTDGKGHGMKKLLFCLLALFFVGSVFAQNSVWFDGTFDQAKAAAGEKGKLLIIDFYQDG